MAKKSGKVKGRRKRVAYLPGMAPPSIKAIDDAAEVYYDRMMARTELSKKEHEAMTSLVEEMVKRKINRYETGDGLIVEVTSKSKCSVKKKKEPKGQDDE